MALYTGAKYRAAHQGYSHYKAQTAALVAADAITDPSLQTGVSTALGPCQMPGADRNENFRGVQGIGESRDMAFVPGRREYGLRTRVEVADGSFLAYAIRDRDDPDAAGTTKGLQLFTLEVGTDSSFGDAYAYQYMDSLINSLRVEIAENANVAADVELWSMIQKPQPSPTTAVIPAADVLIWSNLTATIDGTDYHNILSRVSVTIANGLQRQGMRQQLAALGATEPLISRGCYKIIPTLEQVQVSYALHDELPSALLDSDDWGEITLRAEQAGGGKYLQMVIDQSYLNRYAQGSVAANGLLQFTADTASRVIELTAGTT